MALNSFKSNQQSQKGIQGVPTKTVQQVYNFVCEKNENPRTRKLY